MEGQAEIRAKEKRGAGSTSAVYCGQDREVFYLTGREPGRICQWPGSI